MHLQTEISPAPSKETLDSPEKEKTQNSESQDPNTEIDFDSKLVDAICDGRLGVALYLINYNPLPLNLNLIVPGHLPSPILTHLVEDLTQTSSQPTDTKKIINALINKAKSVNPNEKSSDQYDQPLYLKLINLGEFELVCKILEKSNASVELHTISGHCYIAGQTVSMNPIASLADLAKKSVPGIDTMIRTLFFTLNLTPAQCEEYAKTFPEVKAMQQTKEKISIILDNYAERKGALFFQNITLKHRFNWCLDLVKDINLSDNKKCELFLSMTASHQQNCEKNALVSIPKRVINEYIVCSGIKETAGISEDQKQIFKNMIAKVMQDKLKELTEQKLGKYRGSFIISVRNKLLAYAPNGQLIKQRVVEEVNKAFYEATWPDFASRVESVVKEHLANVRVIPEEIKEYNKNLLCSFIFREFAKGEVSEDREVFLGKLKENLSVVVNLDLKQMVKLFEALPKEKTSPSM